MPETITLPADVAATLREAYMAWTELSGSVFDPSEPLAVEVEFSGESRTIAIRRALAEEVQASLSYQADNDMLDEEDQAAYMELCRALAC